MIRCVLLNDLLFCVAPSNKVTKAQLVESDDADRWHVEFVPHEIG